MLDTAKEYYFKYYTLLKVSLTTAIRQGEEFALTWQDIYFEKNTININKTYSSRDKMVTPPKTASSIRKIYMDPSTSHLLKEYKMSCLPNENNLVFANEKGNYLDRNNVTKRFLKPCIKLAGVTDVTWHQLRHSCLTLEAELCINPKVIQLRAGHSSIETTNKYYIHKTDAMEQDALEKISSVFGS